MIEIRFHGRGGQGAVTLAELLAQAAISTGRYAQSFPSFGPERRGAPVTAFARVSDERIRLRSRIYRPDVAVVLDASLLGIASPADGLKPDGVIIINTRKGREELVAQYGFGVRVAAIDALKIALEELKLPITNTTMLGALVAATGILDPETLVPVLEERFGRLAARNINAYRRALRETVC